MQSNQTFLALCAAAMVVALIGCSGKTKSKDNVAIPKALIKIAETVRFERVWSINLSSNDGVHGELLGPVVIGEQLFAAGENEVVATDKSTGKVQWRKESEHVWSAGPASDGKRVVVASLDGEVSCFDANDGEALWSVSVSSEVLARPVLVDDKIIIRSNDGRVVALNAADGKIAWRFDRDVPLLSLRGSAQPVVEKELIFVPADNGNVAALRSADGGMVWEEAANVSNGRNELERLADIDGDVVVDNGDLFVAGYHGQTSALAASSGSTLWTYQGPSIEGLGFDQRKLFLTDSDSKIIALDRRSGAELWKQDALLNRLATRPAVIGENLVVGDSEGYLHVLNAESGEIIGRTKQGKLNFPHAPVVSDSLLYVQSANGSLTAYRLQ